MNTSGIYLKLFLLSVMFLAGAQMAHGQTAQDDCSPPHRIDWPADHPVWSLCWITPENSSGIDGSGLERGDGLKRARVEAQIEVFRRKHELASIERRSHAGRDEAKPEPVHRRPSFR